MPLNVPLSDTGDKQKSTPFGYLSENPEFPYASNMVTRIRKGARPHLYIMEHLKVRGLDVEQLAGRIGKTRESTYRCIREQQRIGYTDLPLWADAIGLERWQDLTRPPGQPSIDARIDEIPEELREAVFRLVGKAS